MKKTLLAAALASVAAFAPAAHAADGDSPFFVHLRAAHLSPQTSNDAFGAGTEDALGVNSKWIPDISLGYFVTKNIAFDLLLSVPQRHKVDLNGAPLGSFKHLPPTLFAQYHFMPDAQIRPYAGAGLNYTRLLSSRLVAPAPTGPLTLENDSWGPALQVGVDYALDKQWSLSLDVKKIWIKTDVNVVSSGAKLTTLHVDPTVVSAGVGYRF